MHPTGRGNFSDWLYDVLCGWPGLLCCLLYLNLFQESVAPSPMPISLNSILCLPGFHLSGHLTK